MYPQSRPYLCMEESLIKTLEVEIEIPLNSLVISTNAVMAALPSSLVASKHAAVKLSDLLIEEIEEIRGIKRSIDR